MKTYELQKIPDSSYPYIVLSTSYRNPLEEISTIENELKNNFQGRVIFDLLLSNGCSSNRFLEAEFDGKHFKYTSFKPVDCVDEIIKDIVSSFYQNNMDYVNESVLPNAYKFLVKKGTFLGD
jgi:hypothetical protein